MRRRRDKYAWERRGNEFLRTNVAFRRYVLRELERRGPLLARELEDRSARKREKHRWYGSRDVAIMLELLHGRGVVAIVGRRGGQRLWDLGERGYPEPEIAVRIEKDSWVSVDTSRRKQNSYNSAQARKREGEIKVAPYKGKPLEPQPSPHVRSTTV